MNEGVGLIVEVDPAHAHRKLEIGYVDEVLEDLDLALEKVEEYKNTGKAISIGLIGNTAEVLPEMVKRGVIPDVVTDQTSAHDALDYVPSGLSIEQAQKLRQSDPAEYRKRSLESMAVHVKAMLKMQQAGAVVFDYGNNIRQQAFNVGVKNAYNENKVM